MPLTAPRSTARCGGGFPLCDPAIAHCPAGMTCTTTADGCAYTGASIPCGAASLSGLACNFCQWGTCPSGMICGGVPKTDTCGYDCACQPAP